MTVVRTLVTEEQPQLTFGAVGRTRGEMTNTLNSLYVTTRKDDQITTLCTPWTTPSFTIVRNSYAHAQYRLRILTVPKSEAENSTILKHR